jgi:hypothetical protein
MPAEEQGAIARVHPSVSIDAQCNAATEHTVCTSYAYRTKPRPEYQHAVPKHGFDVCSSPCAQATKSHPKCLSHAGGLLEELRWKRRIATAARAWARNAKLTHTEGQDPAVHKRGQPRVIFPVDEDLTNKRLLANRASGSCREVHTVAHITIKIALRTMKGNQNS